MKIKASKKVKPVDAKLHQLKKSKTDIAKPKEKKTAGLVAAAVTPHTFAEKKVLAVKKKNKKGNVVEVGKTKPQPQVATALQVVPQKKQPNLKSEKLTKQQKVAKNVDVSSKSKVIPWTPGSLNFRVEFIILDFYCRPINPQNLKHRRKMKSRKHWSAEKRLKLR